MEKKKFDVTILEIPIYPYIKFFFWVPASVLNSIAGNFLQ